MEIYKVYPATEKFQLEMFKHHLKCSGQDDMRDRFIEAIDAGQVSVTEPPSATVIRSVTAALESTAAITDLNLCLIRNRTDYPFIFSDAPVVYYNTYCRNVRNRGVLGLQCPGLQAFYPLDPWTLAMLFDGEKYSGPFSGFLQHDLHSRNDVSQLNALQLHHSLNAVYYGDPQHEQYVTDLWHAHRLKLEKVKMQFEVGVDYWVDGKPPEGELMHAFEPQIGYDLDLSFIHCQPVAEVDYIAEPRNQELWDELHKLETPSSGKPIGPT